MAFGVIENKYLFKDSFVTSFCCSGVFFIVD